MIHLLKIKSTTKEAKNCTNWSSRETSKYIISEKERNLPSYTREHSAHLWSTLSKSFSTRSFIRCNCSILLWWFLHNKRWVSNRIIHYPINQFWNSMSCSFWLRRILSRILIWSKRNHCNKNETEVVTILSIYVSDLAKALNSIRPFEIISTRKIKTNQNTNFLSVNCLTSK